jgi:3'(2'), 5'-bisphosphate nucleotidase
MPVDPKLAVCADSALIDDITTVISRAAAAVIAIDPAASARRVKADLSPVTAADEAAQHVILEGLSRLLPGTPVVSEEMGLPTSAVPSDAAFVLVDPVDGTREFLAGRDEFTVNIALIANGMPRLGCIAAPALGLIWRGAIGLGAERLELRPGADIRACRSRTPIRTRRLPTEVVIAVSRSHFDPRTDAFLGHFPGARRIAVGSSIKFCRIAEGTADLYPRLAPTHEWDVAAGHAVLAAAGGAVVGSDGSPLPYGRFADGLRVPGFVACGDPAAVDRVSRLAGSIDSDQRKPPGEDRQSMSGESHASEATAIGTTAGPHQPR